LAEQFGEVVLERGAHTNDLDSGCSYGLIT